MLQLKNLLFVCPLLLVGFLNGTSTAETIQGSARVIDGDTLQIASEIVRLQGIDAAESGQRCISADRQIVRPGDQAEGRLQQMASSTLTCTGATRDDYGRLIALCSTSAGIELNRTLVQEGLAWAFVKYSAEFVPEEKAAKADNRGIWSMRCEEPWVFRSRRWEVAAQKAPNGCAIKGNVSANGKIYHTPWSRHYTRTKISETRGERWFCSEGEALKAGWRPPVH